MQQPQLLFDPDQMHCPGGDSGWGVVAEPVEIDQVEPQVGLTGRVVVAALAAVFDRREQPLPRSRVFAAVAWLELPQSPRRPQPGGGDAWGLKCRERRLPRDEGHDLTVEDEGRIGCQTRRPR
ncbi:hypothetical protein [Nocardia nepalensis]|uniref:hypothetical protein n=1 Tax=Nocardia nepalensis TaxID=3375448 RepID=UPI003B66C945